jgi:PQQ system protein
MGGPVRSLVTMVLPLALASCTYAGLLRPNVLKQLTPPVAELVNELPRVDRQNEDIVGRLFAHGGLGHAKLDGDSVMRIVVRVPPDQLIWQPAVIVMPRSGILEIEFQNEDHLRHAALLPSDGDRMLLILPMRTGGRARIRLDEPGMYTFGCPVQNHAGRGMLGIVMVRGDVPEDARLDRPPQPQP